MSYVLVMNCGSSSVKYRLYDMAQEAVLADGVVERIGEAMSHVQQRTLGEQVRRDEPVADYERAFEILAQHLRHPRLPESSRAPAAVGHRVVHGGGKFMEPAAITAQVIAAIRDSIDLAPLHNPANLTGIEAARRAFPDTTHVAVFDTAFYRDLPPRAYLYAIPYEMYRDHGIRRYGFHGTSHRHAAHEAARLLGRELADLRLITCHLGNGCSITAIAGGAAVDTSMGLTPLEGVPMGTRSGDVDPGLFMVLRRRLNMPLEQVDALLNRRSGLLGMSGVSNDMREIERAAEAGEERARLCLEVFAYRVKKQVGAYLAALGGADAVVFTGGIGERSPRVRSLVCANLGSLGLELDEARNQACGGEAMVVSAPHSAIAVLVIPANEELLIARDALRVASGRGG